MKIEIPPVQDYEERINCDYCGCLFTYNRFEDVHIESREWEDCKTKTSVNQRFKVVRCPGCGHTYTLEYVGEEK